jgi:hypothetical protein
MTADARLAMYRRFGTILRQAQDERNGTSFILSLSKDRSLSEDLGRST